MKNVTKYVFALLVLHASFLAAIPAAVALGTVALGSGAATVKLYSLIPSSSEMKKTQEIYSKALDAVWHAERYENNMIDNVEKGTGNVQENKETLVKLTLQRSKLQKELDKAATAHVDINNRDSASTVFMVVTGVITGLTACWTIQDLRGN